MRAASILSILVGAYFVVMAFAAPTILRWQTENTLGTYGATEYVDLAVSVSLERLQLDFFITKVLAFCLIIAGVLMLLRRKAGLYLDLCALLATACYAGYGFVVVDMGILSAIKTLCWLYAIYFVFRAHGQHGAAWWRVDK